MRGSVLLASRPLSFSYATCGYTAYSQFGDGVALKVSGRVFLACLSDMVFGDFTASRGLLWLSKQRVWVLI